MNNEMQKVNRILSFVQKTQKYVIIFLIFPFLSIGEQEKVTDLRSRDTVHSLEQISVAMKKYSHHLVLSKEKLGVVSNFYKLNQYHPIWTDGFLPNPHANEMANLIQNAKNYGLFPDNLYYSEIMELESSLYNENDIDELYQLRADYEFLLTFAGLKFISQLNQGIIKSDSLYTKLNNHNDAFKHFFHLLLEALEATDFKKTILRAQPNSYHYRHLQKGLENWLEDVEPSRDPIYIDESNMVVSVYEALIKHGLHFKTTMPDSVVISEKLKEFQENKGLQTTGLLNDKTRQAITKSTYDYFLQAAVNLERIKLDRLPSSDKYVFVNIPSYDLKVIHKDKIEKAFRAQVGRPHTPTPELTSQIEQIVTCPKWYVPRSIASKELFYHIKKDSSYLEKRNFALLDKSFNEVSYDDLDWGNLNAWNFDYKIMQRPSRSNALGILKFLFPNQYNVYVHDTPSKRYFQEEIRAFSHGCIRLEHPEQFADYLINEMNKTENISTVKHFINRGQTKEIKLKQPVDIAIRYYTCMAGEDNQLVFLNDIYQKDKPIIEQILN